MRSVFGTAEFDTNKLHEKCKGKIEGKIKGGIQETERRERRRKKLLDDLGKEVILSFEGGSSRSHYVESSLWKRLWNCRKTDC
jgi:hypothetical protein